MSYQPRVPTSSRYTAEPVPKTYPGSQGWACACDVPKYRKHKDPPQCVPQAEVDLWRARFPEAVCSDKAAKVLVWLEDCYGSRNPH